MRKRICLFFNIEVHFNEVDFFWRKKMKRVLVFGLLILFCITGVFAAGGGQQKQSAPSGGEKKPAVINLWTHEDPNRQKMEEQFARDYMAANPHVTINYSVYPLTTIQDIITPA